MKPDYDNYDRIEFKAGDRYYKVIISGMVIALCPSEETAKMCYFALTTYKKELTNIANHLDQLGDMKSNLTPQP